MAKAKNRDILLELTDLMGELLCDIKQEVTYLKASVYKDESAGKIRTKISQLEKIISLIGEESLSEPLLDFAAEAEKGGQAYSQGECPFTKRTLRLIQALELAIRPLKRRYMTTQFFPENERQLISTLQKRRRDILAACKQGSNHWKFFATLSTK